MALYNGQYNFPNDGDVNNPATANLTIGRAVVSTFENNVRHLVQQKTTKLLDTVQTVNVTGENHNWERLGTIDAKLKLKSRQATPIEDVEWTRRVSLPKTYDVGTTTEQQDPTFMLVDPNSNLSMAVANAMRRQMDDIIIEAASGGALDGEGNIQALPASQFIDNECETITLDMLADIQTMFMDNHIDPDVQKYAVVSPAIVAQIMKTQKATSSDYVQASALQQYGIVNNWMGFNWRTSTRLLKTDPVSGSPCLNSKTVTCLFYTKQAMGMQMNMGITAKVAEDPTLSFAWRIYSMLTAGAVRVEDEHIIAMDLLNTPTP